MKYVLGIDLGTSYFKAGLFDLQGKLCGLGRAEVKKNTCAGKCEVTIGDFWCFLKAVINQARQQANASANDIIGISYASQANSFLLLDNRNKPLTPLIIWPDKRTGKVYHQVRKLWRREDFLNVTGIGIDCAQEFCLNKLIWFKEELPHLWGEANRIMTISDYLVYSLTGEFTLSRKIQV